MFAINRRDEGVSCFFLNVVFGLTLDFRWRIEKQQTLGGGGVTGTFFFFSGKLWSLEINFNGVSDEMG